MSNKSINVATEGVVNDNGECVQGFQGHGIDRHQLKVYTRLVTHKMFCCVVANAICISIERHFDLTIQFEAGQVPTHGIFQLPCTMSCTCDTL